MRTCGMCSGPLMLLGRLGNRLHFRCRDCGLEWSAEADKEEDEEEDEEEG